MMKYQVRITGRVQMIATVEAVKPEEAVVKAHRAFLSGEYELSNGDYSDIRFMPIGILRVDNGPRGDKMENV